MKFIKSKKGLTVLATFVVAGIVAVGAVAYWTTAGGGSGSGSAAANNASNLIVSGNSSTALAPGTSDTFTLTTENPNPGGAYLKKVTVVVSTDVAHSSCDMSWFKVDNAGATTPDNSIDVNSSVPAKAGLVNGSTTTPVEIWFNESGTDQDACKSAPLTLTYTVNNA
jgi:hypothetical protein